jgi:hypothetical protein
MRSKAPKPIPPSLAPPAQILREQAPRARTPRVPALTTPAARSSPPDLITRAGGLPFRLGCWWELRFHGR